MDRAFANDLLNSCYVASLYSSDLDFGADLCGSMILAAHSDISVDPALIDTAVDALCADYGLGIKQTLDAIDKLPDVGLGPSPKQWEHPLADAVVGLSYLRSPQELEIELLKVAVVSPDLYNNLRSVFIDHKSPDKLDPMGKQMREYFLNLKG